MGLTTTLGAVSGRGNSGGLGDSVQALLASALPANTAVTPSIARSLGSALLTQLPLMDGDERDPKQDAKLFPVHLTDRY